MELELTLRFASFLYFLSRVEEAGYFRIALVLFRIQSPVPFLPAVLVIHLQQQTNSLFQLTITSQVWSYQSKPARSQQRRKFPPSPFAVLLKQTTPFTPNDGAMQHSEQTSITQSLYSNHVMKPRWKKTIAFERTFKKTLCHGHYRSAVLTRTRLTSYFV